MDARKKRGLESAAPALGVAGGILVATKGAEMIGVPAKWAPWGTAAIGTIAAMTTEGWMREAAIGVAAAGASVGILRMVGLLDGFEIPVEHRRQAAAPDAPQREAAAPDAVTQADLQRAMASVTEEHDAQLRALEQKYDEQMRDLRQAYERRIDEICSSYDRRLTGKDETISNLLREIRKSQAATVDPRIVNREPISVEETPADEAPVAQPQSEAASSDAPVSTAPSAEVSKAEAVFDLLTVEEMAQLQQTIASLPPEAMAMAEAHLATLAPEEAAAYLRTHLLAPRAAA
jgi:hypothetical protein